MAETDDISLLKQYAEGDESAFTVLVERYVHLVYCTALRQVGNPSHAEEISQAVFVILTQKAKSLSSRTILSGWLYQTTRLTAANFLRSEFRRQQRERDSYMQSVLTESDTVAWEQIAPLLDEAMGRLGEADRNAVVLRFFENKTAPEVAALLKLNDVTARKRVSRALEKLRKFFMKRGVHSTTAAIAQTISTNAVQLAPAGVAKTISAITVAKSTAVSGSLLTLIKGALKIMAWTKAKAAILVGAGLLLAVSTTTVVVKAIGSPSIDESLWSVNSDNIAKAPAVLVIRPTRFPNSSGMVQTDDRVIGRNMTTASLFVRAYNFSPYRIVLPPDIARQHYDLMLTLPSHQTEALREGISKQLGLVARPETITTNVLLLKSRNRDSLASRITSGGPPCHYQTSDQYVARIVMTNEPASSLAATLEDFFGKPMIDQTGLTDHYDINLQWKTRDRQADREKAVINQLAQLGLELVPGREPIEMLVVEQSGNSR